MAVIDAWRVRGPGSVIPIMPPPIIAGARWLKDMGRLAETALLRRINEGDLTAAWLAAEGRFDAVRPAIEESAFEGNPRAPAGRRGAASSGLWTAA